MSLEPPYASAAVSEGTVDYDELAQLIEDALLDRETHVHAEGFVIRPDDVQEVLETLKTEAGFDHLSCVTAQEYHDRYESIYHLKQYRDPRRELSIVVPIPKDDPVSESASPVFPTAEWHEREAYDLVGIEYADHPNLKRILLPETWLGHPLSLEYDQSQPQIVTLREHANPLEETHRDGQDTMFLNIGPHHPSTHGVLHLKAVLDGEQVADVEPDIGYIHRCEEQMCQECTYRHQIMPYPDRWDWSRGGLCNEWAYARTAEALADIVVPEYAQILRTMTAELSWMLAHFLAIGTYALDVNGGFTAAFMYATREREEIQELLEALTGQRLMFNYFRLGGVAWDLPTPREEFFERAYTFLNVVPRRLEEYHMLMTNNEIFQMRTVDTVWRMVVGEDFAFSETTPTLPGTDIANWCMNRLIQPPS